METDIVNGLEDENIVRKLIQKFKLLDFIKLTLQLQSQQPYG